MATVSAPAPAPLVLTRLAEIASGPTARVDLCRAAPDGKLVAVKRLHPAYADDAQFVSRFLDEVWMTAALKHPNVVEVAGFGTDAEGTYLAVELVQGVSLARLAKTVFDTGEDFTERMVVFIAASVCRGLEAAHGLRSRDGREIGFVHRDLTSANVLVGFNGDVKISDFGLAKAKERLTTTTVGILARPTLQMAPEEVSGHEVDHRADLFSLGVMLFELLARRPPWMARSEIDTLTQIAHEPPPEIEELRPRLDPEIAAIVRGCLEKDPNRRFGSAGAIASRLDRWLAAHGYGSDNDEALARFVRRNAMRQMRWFEQAVAGQAKSNAAPPIVPGYEAPRTAPRAPVVRRSEATAVAKRGRLPSIADEPTADETKRPAPSSMAKIEALREQTASRPAIIREADFFDDDSEDPTLIQKRRGSSLHVIAAQQTLLGLGDKGDKDEAILDPASEDGPTVSMTRDDLGLPKGPPRPALRRKPPAVRRPTPPPASATEVLEVRSGVMLHAEATRLKELSERHARAANEASAAARDAAAKAARAEAMCKVAEQAASMAAEAVTQAIAGNAAQARSKLDQALALEASMSAPDAPKMPRK